MPGLKQMGFAAAATAALLFLPIRPAAAAGPLFFAPWALAHVVGVAARIATLPLVLASAAAAAGQPQAPYPTTPAYYGGPGGYYPPSNYYAPSPAYYAQPPGYYRAPRAYYRPAFAYAPRVPQFYAPPRGYYPQRAPYSGSYGAHAFDRSGDFAYRRR
jgi:hypothetical protein